MEYRTIEGDSPVKAAAVVQTSLFPESHCLRVQCKVAGEYLLKLNIRRSPIAYKYREGKMKRTLKRELKGTEIAEREVEGLNGLAVLCIRRGHRLTRMLVVCNDSGSGCSC